MCGIVGAVAQRNVTPILLEGLKRLEYRGYDSAGLCIVLDERLERLRSVGKVNQLETALSKRPLDGAIGVAHTRWATHGAPTEKNAHPHICENTVAIVHNGIIENHDVLKASQTSKGYRFTSETDTEVIVHQIHQYILKGNSLIQSVRETTKDLEGAYALGVIYKDEPGKLIAARHGSPLVVGIGVGEYFIASDQLALLAVTQQFIFLEDGDIAELSLEGVKIFDIEGNQVDREIVVSSSQIDCL